MLRVISEAPVRVVWPKVGGRRRRVEQRRLHVVHVREIEVADGDEPIDWKLVTTGAD